MRSLLFFLPICGLFLASCSENGTGGTACDSDFDQEAMFVNLADNLILPAYEDLSDKLNELKSRTDAYSQGPSVAGLEEAREALLAAWVSWQYAASYEFGPAEEVFLRQSLNPFPVNVNGVEELVQNGGDNFDNPSTFDKGFPALDYLLAGLADEPAGMVSAYTTGPNAEGYRRYLQAVVEDMIDRLAQVRQRWLDGYRDLFVANTGTAAGTALSQIINGLNENYEFTKRDRLGIPSGALTLGLTNPDQVEARFLGLSTRLAEEAVTATQLLYRGQSRGGTNGPGLDDYLNEIDARKGNGTLHQAIESQFDIVFAELEKVTDPLREFVDADNVQIQKTYAEASNLVILLKTDMPSVLCVSITYVDNPSDSD